MMPALSEQVSEVGLFQGSIPLPGHSPQGLPQALDTDLKIWGKVLEEWPWASAWSF